MFRNLIIKYIPKITRENVVKVAHENQIFLSDDEIDIVLREIKENYQVLLSPSYMKIFEKNKMYFKEENYQKIYNLFIKYATTYKIF